MKAKSRIRTLRRKPSRSLFRKGRRTARDLSALVVLFFSVQTLAADYLAKPWVTNVRHTSATIAWLTKDKEAPAVVQYGTSPRLGKKARVWKVQTSDWRKHDVVKVMKAKLTGLKPGTRYFYRVAGAGLPEYANAFRTAPRDPKTPVVFLFGGDYNMPSDEDVEYAAKRTGRPVDFFLDLGDHAIPRRFRKEWQGSIPVFLARGNHDNEKGTKDRGGKGKIGQIEKFYDFDDDNLDFVVDWGPMRLIVMGRMPGYSKPLRADQLRWIEQQFAATRAPWRFLACHYVMFSDSSHGSKGEGEEAGRLEQGGPCGVGEVGEAVGDGGDEKREEAPDDDEEGDGAEGGDDDGVDDEGEEDAEGVEEEGEGEGCEDSDEDGQEATAPFVRPDRAEANG